MPPQQLAPLPKRATVLRLVRNLRDHFPPDAKKPLPGALKLTKDDLADGAARGTPPVFSVFLAERTSVTQARAIRGQDEDASTPFCWKVDGVVRVQSFEGPLAVVADPEPWASGPGARGHSGITGLVPGCREPKGPEKLIEKRVRSELIDLCERFDPTIHPSPSLPIRLVDEVVCRFARVLGRSRG